LRFVKVAHGDLCGALGQRHEVPVSPAGRAPAATISKSPFGATSNWSM
jgi:hypothetical protein